MQGPGTPSNLIVRVLVSEGPGAGTFVYSGTPALGNPPIAWMTGGTTDPYGNALPTSGIVSAAGSAFAALLNGAIEMSPFSGAATNAFILCNTNDLRLVAPTSSLTVTAAKLDLISDLGVPAVPNMSFNGSIQAQQATAAQPHILITDAWNNVTPPTGFTGLLRYRLRAENDVEVEAMLAVAATAPTGTIALFSYPAGYTPLNTQHGACGLFLNGAPASLAAMGLIADTRWSADSSGGAFNLRGFPGGAAGSGVTEVSFNIRYALD